MDADYGHRYRELYQRHWWWRAREAALLETLHQIRPAAGWGRILDIGCGDGLFFDRLLEFGEVEGIEPSAELVSADGPHRQRIHVRPFDDSFQPQHRFGLITMLDVLEHLDDPVGALGHALHLLAPDGTMLITVPAFNLLWTNHDVINHHRIRYTKASFRKVAQQAGFRIDQERYWFQWIFPVKVAGRLVERALGSEPAPAQVPSASINNALYRLSRIEHRLLSPLRLPFGSSLVVVGGATALSSRPD
jgi:SAM-dependent methyltransferase